MCAASNGCIDSIRLLLSEEGMKTTKNSEITLHNKTIAFPPGATALMIAVAKGHSRCIPLLEKEVRMQDNRGWTALMYAAHGGHIDCVRLLLSETGLQSSKEANGMPKGTSALMLAAQHGEVGCVKLLLEEADLENSQGESALDIAESVGSKASHHTRCQCCALILRDDAGAGVGVGRHLSVAQRKLLTMQELSTAFSGDDAQHVENAFSNIIAELNFLRQLTEQQDRRANAAEIAALQRRLEEKDAEVAAERQEYGRRIAELTAHLQERTDELEKRTLELQTTVRMPQPILTGDGYTLDELELLEKNLTTSLKAITTSRAVLQSSSCIVCLMNPKDTLLQPCNHLCVCSTCAEQIMNQTCPLCRTSIDNTVKVHL
ncbi:Ankyrin repeat protein 2 [Giardia muris]|uniref:Ankyrin repeat protein 2 n=1 Tax=Giardia muris TaxID=5742 RepID=A0A4Z1STN8_GIAMU|nr:Ankyrin repeat protein 2 [Giardia muris]|eukprot:TNJ28355.1 Ankyrin repeat protein 2 [Giardia muris]